MSQGNPLSADALRSLLELIVGLDQRGPGSAERVSVMLEGMARHSGARAASLLQTSAFTPAALDPDQCELFWYGLDQRQQRAVRDYLTRGAHQHPIFQPLASALCVERDDPLVFTRRELVSDRVWGKHSFTQWRRQTLGLDDCLLAIRREPEPGNINMLTLHRGAGEAGFGPAERELARLFWGAAGRLFCPEPEAAGGPETTTAIAEAEARLSPRLREIFQYVRRGFDAQQIANHLGLSIHTVYEHLQRLYQALGVANRRELIAVYANPVTSDPAAANHRRANGPLR
jgi:DNA-binding CsgD family transcriptional regulator